VTGFVTQAFNQLGPSPWSLLSAFSTQASVPTAPDPPVHVGSSADAVTLQWVPPAENGAPISGYTLEVDDGRGGDFRLAYTGGDTSTTVAGLQVGRRPGGLEPWGLGRGSGDVPAGAPAVADGAATSLAGAAAYSRATPSAVRAFQPTAAGPPPRAERAPVPFQAAG
jgi:hypothetical protein